jgi:hypothetical protein
MVAQARGCARIRNLLLRIQNIEHHSQNNVAIFI